MDDDKKAMLRRLKKIEGQVRGIAAMVEDDRYCVDVLTQAAAARAALRAVERLIVKNHAATCIEDAIASGDPENQRRKFDELVALIDRN